MSIASILKGYLCINILLIFSFLIFLLFRRVAVFAKIFPSHTQLIRVGQAIILLSIAAPIVLQAIPQRHMVKMELRILRPPAEEDGSFDEIKKGQKKKLARDAQFEKNSTSKVSFLDHMMLWFRSEISFSLFVVLFIGFLFSFFRFFKNILGLQKLIASTTSIRTLGRVRVVVAESITVPFSVWLWPTSWVVLPNKILENGNDFRLAIRHELQHHRQGDTLWAILTEILLCIFFPNPVLYFWKKEITELQEFSCDEALIGRKGVSSYEYGSCLVRVAEAALGNRKMYVGTTCMAVASRNPISFKSFLRRRVEMFENHKSSKTHRWAGAVMGTAAAILTLVFAFGAEQALRNNNQDKINPGQIVVDPEIQKIADSVLAKAIRDENARSGFAIVADPNTGKILAVANMDTTNKRAGYWSLSELFEPASIVKTLVVAQAIDRELTTPEERHHCENGNYRYGDRVYHDWKKAGWESLSTAETISNSSDICTMKISERIGPKGLLEMFEGFGFGPNGTAKYFPQARTGQLPPMDEDLEHPRLVPYSSMGAGFNISPIEMIQAYGAIANGGNLMVPKMANTADSEAQVIRRVLSFETSDKMRAILEKVVREGTAKPGESKIYTMAGKTATSHYPRHMPFDPNDGNFAGFIGFAPVKDPRVEVYVGIRDPESENGAHGGGHAAPVVRNIVEEVLKFMKVAPDKL